MAIKKHRPTTPTRRYQTVSSFEELTKKKPEKTLTVALKSSGGRNRQGRITTRHRGGGHKRKYRIIDFKRNKDNILARVVSLEYDPNRSSRIALLEYEDKEKRYIIAPQGLKVGNEVISGKGAGLNVANSLSLDDIPPGTPIHNVELSRGKGGQLVRSAGGSCVIMAKEAGFAQVRLPSGEVRMIDLQCRATIGQVGNIDHERLSLGKAGRSRWLGRRPSVRGVAMNPHDHPLGGGEGKSSGGRHPSTPWGKPTKGYKTRKKNKPSDKYIVRKRGKKR